MKFTHQRIPWPAWTINGIYGGLDIVLGRTAFCVLTYGALHVYVIETATLTGGTRLSYLHSAVDYVVRHHEIESVAVEGGAYGAGGRIYELGGASAVGQLALAKASVPYYIVPPTSLKKFFTGNGSSGKPKMIAQANALLGSKKFIRKNEDEADAFALALLAAGISNPKTIQRRPAMDVAVKQRGKELDSIWTPAQVTELV